MSTNDNPVGHEEWGWPTNGLKPMHTPGPWHAYRWAETHYRAGFAASVGQDDELGMEAVDVCRFFEETEISKEESNANAKLIAAAPEMLEVLMKFMDFKESEYVPNTMFDRASEAIRKAVVG